MTYGAVWARCCGVLALLGFGLALVVWGPATVVSFWVLTALCLGLLIVLFATLKEPPGSVSDVPWKRIALRSIVLAGAVTAVAATVVSSPVSGLVLVAIAAATSPWARERHSYPTARVPEEVGLRGTWRPVPAERTSQDSPVEAVSASLSLSRLAAQALSNEELCREWRRSFVALQCARSHAEFMRIVGMRQVYLDEMDRRSPAGLDAWLASGGRAASGPDRYLRDPWRRPPGAA